MANRKRIKVPINKEALFTLIENKTSIRKIGPSIGYNEKTIRRGLNDGEMSLEIILLLSRYLSVEAREFAYFDKYYELLKENTFKKTES